MLSHGSKNSLRLNIALLGAFCLFLSAVEYMIPKPLPFMRIGLANLPLMMALDIFPLPAFLLLVCIKTLGQGLITGTLFSYIFIFSLTGTFLSAMLMFLLRRIFGKERITLVGIGTAGAFISNISQLALARVFIFQENVRYIAPPFLTAGIITGIVLGVFCEVFINRSTWYKMNVNNGGEEDASFKTTQTYLKINHKDEEGVQRKMNMNELYNNIFSAGSLFAAGLLILPALLFNPSTELRVIQFLFFWFLALLCGKKTNPVFTVLIIIFIVTFNLIIPYGRVLYSIGAFKITSGALTAGIHRAITLAALVMLSKLTVRQDLKISGAFGEILSESLRMFYVIMSRKYRLTAKNFLTDVDNLMIELSGEQRSENKELLTENIMRNKTRPIGYVVLIVMVILSWLPCVVNLI